MAAIDALETRLLEYLSAPARSSPALARALRICEDGAPIAYAATFAWVAWRSADDPPVRSALVRTTLAGSVAVLGAGVVARALPRSRPSLTLWASRRSASDSHSFPSDHAAGASAFALASSGLPRGARRALVALSATTIVSRVLLARHWPSDVLAALAIGAAASTVAGALPSPMVNTLGEITVRWLGLSARARRTPTASRGRRQEHRPRR
ncbi:phosphoesterase PA-phosphatase related [Acidimicrobium ferrooxidans DSM 10331]|uniref:Phosphoesterase PA-phosphatase related n=1 Tax=Acidimicrobium ferrooxidans (strain DSM 10331 / JCM 15462 / NBRC 103882 / ICP) TaxID=525909 RepID=C7LZB4_ACIFD|nr:phosphatase PAP2 family protein [Acidimicrobium ferrooxidans]ACU54072.1 phosphoesterase PA-phosphatase related [Acidimicrobium ferrooxidans DSM 10331]